MRLVFMGTPAFAVPALERLASDGHVVAAVYTRAPKPAGRRGLHTLASPVHLSADRLALPVHTPASLRGEEAADVFRSHRADVAVVAAYGLLLPAAILDAPVHGCLNLHASLLPRWRGAAPIHRAVMAGDALTGATVMRMDEGLDTGPIGPTVEIPIGENDTTGDVHDRIAQAGAKLLSDALASLARGELAFVPQPEQGASYAKKIDKSELRVDWTKPAKTVRDQIRGLSPAPGAWSEIDFGRGLERIKILECRLAEGGGLPGVAIDNALAVACGEGAVRITSLQRPGKEQMSAESLLRGTGAPAGVRLL